MLNRLNTDRSLSRFAGQFVPVKLITDGNAEWSRWATQYRPEGNGIPYLYVVRADGTMLYGKSGALPGDALPQMLLAALQQSGRTFNDAEVALLEQSVQQAETALAGEDNAAAAAALSQLTKLGQVGKLGSLATAAVKADELAAKVSESGTAEISAAKEQLSDEATAFDGVLTLLDAQSSYAGFAELREQVSAAMTEAKKDSSLREPIAQVEALLRARKQAAAANPAVRRRAAKAYELVIERYPGTKVDQLARAELAEIDPDSAALSSTPSEPVASDDFRTWTSADGRFQVRAKLLDTADGKVQLEKENGEKIVVPISRLSDADQRRLND